MPSYKVNSHSFLSVHAAIVYAAHNTPDTPVKFDLYDDEFDKIDWRKEPTTSFDTLMEIRAVQLRNKFKKLVLSFSGGTDSITIYNVFKKLNIHLDEIVIMYEDDDSVGHPKQNVEWLLKNCYDPTTKITVADRNDLPAQYKTLKEDFVTDNNYLHSYNFNGGVTALRVFKMEDLQSDTAFIVGYEKPHIVYDGTAWYVTHKDNVFSPSLDNARFEWFFITPELPELHIKQCHMVKNNAKRFINPQRHSRWDSANYSFSTHDAYLNVAAWCGRHVEITQGTSFSQKRYLQTNPLDIYGIMHGNKTKISDRADYQKYLSGYKALQADNTIVEYMRKFKMFDLSLGYETVDKINVLSSKPRFLGFV